MLVVAEIYSRAIRLFWRQFCRCVSVGTLRNELIADLTTSLRTYGAEVDQLKAEIGMPVLESELENSLMTKKYKAVTFTHVDTSYVDYHYLQFCGPYFNQDRSLIKRKTYYRDSSKGFSRNTCTWSHTMVSPVAYIASGNLGCP